MPCNDCESQTRAKRIANCFEAKRCQMAHRSMVRLAHQVQKQVAATGVEEVDPEGLEEDEDFSLVKVEDADATLSDSEEEFRDELCKRFGSVDRDRGSRL